MVKKLGLIVCFLLSTGCAAHRIPMMPVPEFGTREALLPTYEPSGSPCLDSIIINFLYAGCSEAGVASGAVLVEFDEPVTYMGCLAPQPGAMDPFSNYTFVRVPEGLVMPPDVFLYCGDQTAMYGYIPVPILSIIEHE
jgi:hypothetical protein